MAFEAPSSRGEALARLREELRAVGIDSPRLEARLLVGAAAGASAAELLARPDEPLGPEAAERLGDYARRRLSREPLARILGVREFWGMPFRLSAGTLEPRPDTEAVVEAALSRAGSRDREISVLDLGTGSGCILVALLAELPAATGLGVDRSLDALRTARANAAANGVGSRALFAASHWAQAVSAPFDLVVGNLPYIPTGDIEGLSPDVSRHDPLLALDGGSDGLLAFRDVLGDLPRLLAPAGSAVLEIGHDQAAALRRLAAARGLSVDAVVPDLAGRDRAVILAKSAA